MGGLGQRLARVLATVTAAALVAVPTVRSNTTGAATPIPYASGAADLLVRFGQTDIPFAKSPSLGYPFFSLYGDGRVILASSTFSGSGPRLPNLRTLRLTEAGIQSVLVAARDAGLTDGNRQVDRPCGPTDMPTTVFTTSVGGETSTVTAYALGFEPNRGAPLAERIVDAIGGAFAGNDDGCNAETVAPRQAVRLRGAGGRPRGYAATVGDRQRRGAVTDRTAASGRAAAADHRPQIPARLDPLAAGDTTCRVGRRWSADERCRRALRRPERDRGRDAGGDPRAGKRAVQLAKRRAGLRDRGPSALSGRDRVRGARRRLGGARSNPVSNAGGAAVQAGGSGRAAPGPAPTGSPAVGWRSSPINSIRRRALVVVATPGRRA